MKNQYLVSISFAAIAALAACSSVSPEKSPLELARSDYVAAQNNPQIVALAPVELKDAGDALQKANMALARSESPDTIDHLAYLTRQKVVIAEETTRQKSAEQRVADANAVRDRIQLDARTREADLARQKVFIAQTQAKDAEMRNSELEAQIKDLNAKQTARGYVITFGDVLFATDESRLKRSGMRNVDKLVNFLTQYPQRTVLIEGFTDSTGSKSKNLRLSERRSQAVQVALINSGINSNRISTMGLGESYPVASNGNASGRQLNRRVEIVLSDASGTISSR
jgi:outer membrane protein OmpA-like peptidoglycan-associated protein